MIDSIQNMIQAIERFENKTDDIILDLVALNEGQIVFLNTDNQLFQGIDAKGKKLFPPYSRKTIKIKRAKGQPTNRVTLLDTGDFHNSFLIVYGNDFFEITANDRKTKKLELKYGSDIFGLTDNSLQILINMIKDQFINEARKHILSGNTFQHLKKIQNV